MESGGVSGPSRNNKAVSELERGQKGPGAGKVLEVLENGLEVPVTRVCRDRNSRGYQPLGEGRERLSAWVRH